MKIFHSKKQIFVYFLLFFLLGILYANFSCKNLSDINYVFSEYYLEKYQNADIPSVSYILYILRVRSISISIILVLSFTRFRKANAWITFGWTGFLAGFLMSLAVICMGLKGSIFCVVAIFPQFLCYVPVYFVILWYAITYPQNRWNSQKSLFVFGAVMAGIVLESYTNPIIVRAFLRML